MTIRRYQTGIHPDHQQVMICSVCENLLGYVKTEPLGTWTGPRPEQYDYSQLDDAWRGAHHVENGSFLAAVATRCYICFSIHRDCSRRTRKFLNACRTFFELRQDGKDRYSINFTVELREDDTPDSSAARVFDCLGTFKIFPRADLPDVGTRLKITENTLTNECQTQIRSWLAACEHSHDHCRNSWQTRSDYPIRLLKVGRTTTQHVHLESFDGNRPHPKYVTLSHCWNHNASANKFQLTSRNRRNLEVPFPTSVLPQKFRHAVDIARWMGVDYLWIDALCVMQDSKNDWMLQAGNVGNIYSGSYCNIAATNGDENVGLLGARPVDIVEPSFVPDPKSDLAEKSYILGYDDFWCNSLLDTRLHNRGWVLQERLLSPRTIHFAQEQFFFECRELKACEAYPTGLPPQLSNWRTKAWRKGEQVFHPTENMLQRSLGPSSRWNLFNWSNPPQRPNLSVAYDFWSSMVKRYMDCSLTFDEDKLIAISGLANKLALATKERYLAGLWENSTLPQALLWYVPTQSQADGSPSRRMPSLNKFGYRAPSWSWASLEARISWNWPTDCADTLLDIENTDLRGSNHFETGAVEHAMMNVCASLLPVKLRIPSQLADGSPDEDGSYVVQLQRDANAPKSPPATTEHVSGPELDPMCYLDTAIGVQEIDAWLLPVCTQWRGRSGGMVTPLAGLLVKKSFLGERQVFERIGMFGLDIGQIRVVCKFYGLQRDGLDGLQRLQRNKVALI